jgi:putative FmdB family regulatory protein
MEATAAGRGVARSGERQRCCGDCDEEHRKKAHRGLLEEGSSGYLNRVWLWSGLDPAGPRRQKGAMPVYEYVCHHCSAAFEELVFPGDAAPVCPSCQAPDAERVLSVVAVGRSDAAPPARAMGPCGSCGDPRGPGACKLS